MIIDSDCSPAFRAFISEPPPGVKVLLAARDAEFVAAMRSVFSLPLPDDFVLVTSDGSRYWAAIPPGLVVQFAHHPHDSHVTAMYAGHMPHVFVDERAAIAAWESLYFRRIFAPIGRIQ